MPEDIPIYPTNENKEVLLGYINLQKQLETIYKNQHEVIDDISKIDLQMEQKLTKRLARERELVDIQKDILDKIAEQYKVVKAATKETEPAAKLALAGLKEELLLRSKEAELLGLSNEIEIAQIKRRFAEEQKWFNFISKISRENLGFKFAEYDKTKAITEELEKYPFSMKKSAGIISATIVLLIKAFEIFKSFDKAAFQFRMKMGAIRSDVKGVRDMAEKVAIQFTHVGVTIDGVYESVFNLGQEMGSIFNVTKDLATTTALLKSQLGVSEETSAKFFRNIAALSKSTMQAQQDMGYVAQSLSAAAGVPLPGVMQDVAKLSGTALTMVSRMPIQLIKSAIEARRLNTTIDAMAKGSREILNFTDNIAAEMEASVLLGHSINLQRARELAYRRDIEGSTKEILRITKAINFEGLDTFQMEAFARATGRSVDDLLKMVQAERQLDAARKDPKLADRVAKYDQLKAANAAVLKDTARQLELNIMQRSNQERLTAISQRWQSILAKVSELFLPIIDGVLAVLEPMVDIVPLVMATAKGLSSIVIIVGDWVKYTAKLKAFNLGLATAVGRMGKPIEFLYKMGSKVLMLFSRLGGTFSFLGRFLGVFAKVLGPIGLVIAAVQFIYSLFHRFSSIEFVKGDWIGNIWKGIKAVAGSIYDVLLKPFYDAWLWIKSIFVGSSPSTIGLGIVRGLASVGAMIFDSLTAPFRLGLSWIMNMIPGLSKISDKVRGGFSSMLEPVENKVTATYVPAVQVNANGTATPQTIAPKGQTVTVGEDAVNQSYSDKKLCEILDAINALNKNLEAGKIGFYIDGQLMSATLARQTEFRGGYGVNKV